MNENIVDVSPFSGTSKYSGESSGFSDLKINGRPDGRDDKVTKMKRGSSAANKINWVGLCHWSVLFFRYFESLNALTMHSQIIQLFIVFGIILFFQLKVS